MREKERISDAGVLKKLENKKFFVALHLIYGCDVAR
jgi:hypothetical protein